MHFLLFEWNGLIQQDLEASLLDAHCTFRRFSFCFRDDGKTDDLFIKRFTEHLANHTYDAVISFNYFPLVSHICERMHLKYISWCYDSPVRVSDTDSLANSCNTVILFDRKEAMEYQSKGFNKVYHLPLAVYPQRINATLSTSRGAFQCDVSFLGNFHHGNLTDFLNPLPDFEKGYLQGLIQMQRSLSGTFVTELFSVKELLKRLNPYYQQFTGNPEFILSENDFTFLFGKYVSETERRDLLEELSKICQIHVYSNQPYMIPSQCNYRGSADYYSQMPLIFHESKINLNPTFHCIRSGIPLRALDILSCGGFLLCNAQEEMFDYFSPFEEFAYYDTLEQAKDLVSYYLKNENERIRIAQAGCQKAQALFSYQVQLPRVMKIAGII